LRQLFRFGDCPRKINPGNDLLDGSKRISSVFLSRQQCLSDAGVKAHLFVDGFARGLECLVASATGFIEDGT
jgi:hypothetical protein